MNWANQREKICFVFNICLFQVLVVVLGIFSCIMWDGIWFPEGGIEPRPLALTVQSLSHWATREMPERSVLSFSLD